jgi:hypothetical protein
MGKFIFMSFFISLIIQSNAQSITMKDGIVTNCGGMFFDSGGKDGNYGADEHYILTIAPEKETIVAGLIFYEFELGENDYLAVFDGNSISAPSLGVYSKDNPAPKNLIASFNNSSGALTFLFQSEKSSSYSGWIADITCTERPVEVFNNSTLTDRNEFVFSVEGIVDSNHAFLIDEHVKKYSGIYDIQTNSDIGEIIVSADKSIDIMKVREMIISSRLVTGKIIKILSMQIN